MDNNREHLYDVPLDELQLSQNAIELLGRVAIATIGDCLDFIERGGDVLLTVPYGFFDAFTEEITPKLIQHGYIDHD